MNDTTITFKTSGVNSVEENSAQPTACLLLQNYPNPFNPETTIRYQINKNSFVSIKVYDVLGKEIAVLVNERKEDGTYAVKFNASNFPTGLYFYTLRAGSFVETRKMIFAK